MAGAVAICAGVVASSGCGESERTTTVTRTVTETAPAPAAPKTGAPDGDPEGPRLEGTWEVRQTVRRGNEKRFIEEGETSTDGWEFKPQCPTGACDIRLTMSGAPRPAREVVLTPRGRFLSGTVRYLDTMRCENGSRELKGLKNEDRVTLEVTDTDPSGRARAFRGRYTSTSEVNFGGLSAAACIDPGLLKPVEEGLEGKRR